MLSPYYKEYGIDVDTISVGPGRAAFSSEAADVLDEFKPPVMRLAFGRIAGASESFGREDYSVRQRPSRHSTFNRK
jgi:hypothetical protein